MGVRKLNKFLTTKQLITEHNNLYEYVKTLELHPEQNNCKTKQIVIAIDFWLYAHKFLHSSRSNNIVMGFWNQIIKILSYGAIPVYIADGYVPIEKEDEYYSRKRRFERKKGDIDKINETLDEYDEYIGLDEIEGIELAERVGHTTDTINVDQIDALIEKRERLLKQIKRVNRRELRNILSMFETMSVPFIRACYEADALCVKLYKDGLITTCMSDDMDMLALGCGSTIKFDNGKLIEFNLERIKSGLELDQEQFIDICIMFGCGYLRHPIRIECQRAYEIIKESGSLLDALFRDDYPEFNTESRNIRVLGENYHSVQDIYLYSPDKETSPEFLFDYISPHGELVWSVIREYLESAEWFDTTYVRTMRHAKYDIHTIIQNFKNAQAIADT